MSEQHTSVAAALEYMQRHLKAPKGQYNKFGGYSYRSCEDILDAAKKVLPEGFFINVSDVVQLIGDRYYVKATALISNGTESISTEAYARESQDKKGMDAAQITGSASSYARKYALNGLFCIDDTKDADTEEIKNQADGQAKKESEHKDKLEAVLKSKRQHIAAIGKCTSAEELRQWHSNNLKRINDWFNKKTNTQYLPHFQDILDYYNETLSTLEEYS